MISIIVALAAALFIFSANSNGNNMDYTLQRTRNQYLRFYISTKKSQTKHIIREIWIPINVLAVKTKEKSRRIYNSVLSKYHDAHIAYYSLSQEDRELIDQIINLHF